VPAPGFELLLTMGAVRVITCACLFALTLLIGPALSQPAGQTTSACYGQYKTPTGVITSPSLPATNGGVCNWTISVDPTTFFGMYLEFSLFTSNACCDFVEIYEGTSTASGTLIGRFSGSTVPPQMFLSSTNVFIVFYADLSVVASGFQAAWSAVMGSCGGTFTTTVGTIRSPNYPNDYTSPADCVWNIQPPTQNGGVLTLTFSDLKTNQCCDFVQVQQGTSINGSVIGSYGGSIIPSPIQTTTNSLRVEFKATSSVPSKGFRAVWNATSLSTASGPGAPGAGGGGAPLVPAAPLAASTSTIDKPLTIGLSVAAGILGFMVVIFCIHHISRKCRPKGKKKEKKERKKGGGKTEEAGKEGKERKEETGKERGERNEGTGKKRQKRKKEEQEAR